MQEAKEVSENNDWFTYAEPLHRLREFGNTDYPCTSTDCRNSPQGSPSVTLIYLSSERS